jgi:hypothetical protein
MKRSSMVVAALLAAVTFVPALQALPQDHHEHAAAPAPAVVPAQRYTPDAPLRAGMRTAHQAIAQLQHAEAGHMSAALTRDRAATVEQAVVSMFANCKLSAEPDAALHGILVPLLTAAQALQATPDHTQLVADMRAAIARYPQYFDDPGWDQPAATADAHSTL